MKHIVTNLDDPNEPILFVDSILGNYGMDSFLGNFLARTSSFIDSRTRSKLLHCTHNVTHQSTVQIINKVSKDLNTWRVSL